MEKQHLKQLNEVEALKKGSFFRSAVSWASSDMFKGFKKIIIFFSDKNIFNYKHFIGLHGLTQTWILRKLMGAIHSTKIQTGPTGKRGPPQKVDLFFRNFSGWTEPIHWVLDRNFRKFWLNGSRPWPQLFKMWTTLSVIGFPNTYPLDGDLSGG